MSTVREFFLGKGEFKTREEIIATIKAQKDFDPGTEDLDSAEAILIFQTSRQQTWFVVTNVRLYCVLDDLDKSSTKVQWGIKIENLADAAGNLKIATRDKTERTGFLDIGERRNWLFSKKLFASESPETKIRELISHQKFGNKRIGEFSV